MAKKLRVLLVQGGPSNEHNISLASGKMIFSALDTARYNCKIVTIAPNGKWKFTDALALTPGNALAEIERQKFDVAFIALHGKYGEDGEIQSTFETIGLSYTGSGTEASTLAMNKAVSGALFKQYGLHTPSFIHVANADEKSMLKHISYPAVIKPCHGGSSVRISFAKNATDAWRSVQDILGDGDSVIVQDAVKGREFTCGILDDENGNPQTLPPTEIIPVKGAFFDYDSKYLVGGSHEITPPDISNTLLKEIQDAAMLVHAAFGCSGMSRSDFIFDGKKLHILELNTIPGMTKTSLLPQAAAATGLTFSDMLDRIIHSALQKA